MAFESLSDKFQAVFKKMRKEDKLTEENMDAALREIRIALLEADVNYKVVKAFTDDVKEKAAGPRCFAEGQSLSEMLIKICHDELVSLLGADNTEHQLTSKARSNDDHAGWLTGLAAKPRALANSRISTRTNSA
jgi:signal recognition particle subunit SRP54